MNLLISAITIVDLTNKKAKRICFQPGKNLLTSKQNHLGKSVIMKSIFYTLGAEVFFPAPIKRVNLFTYIDFSLDTHQYRVARLKNTFALFCDGAFVEFFASCAAFEEHLSKLFKLEINLVGKDDEGTIVKCPPAYYYMPYYVDQENGWSANSYSFDRMGQFDLPQRKNSYFFHLGVLDSSYVNVAKLHKANDKQISFLTKEIEKYRTVVETLQAGLDETQMSFDTETLEKAIASRQAEIRRILSDIASIRSTLIEAEDTKVHLEYEKEVLSRYIKKKQPVLNSMGGAVLECPRCGMMFQRDVTQQLEKIYLIESLHDDYTSISEKLVALERRICKYRQKFEAKQRVLSDYESSLELNKGAYNAYLKSKATGQLLREYRDQIAADIAEIEELRAVNSGYAKLLDAYTKERTTVNTTYLSKLGNLCTHLDVPADQIIENSEPGTSLVASGAYGPRCKIAQILAFVETQRLNAPELITFPIVIDSPNVLEQDDEHLDSVIRTLLTWDKTDNQIIVASIQGKETAEELGNVNIISLTNPKNHLLNSGEYSELETEIVEVFTHF
ncbi:hypothetical protein [Sharpea azabuensis]